MINKTKIGIIVSNKALKTITVMISIKYKHKKYGKYLIKHKRYLVHNENISCKLGNFVLIEEVAPISRHKNWNLKKVLFISKK
jgi:small subunit ribosomal protein S17